MGVINGYGNRMVGLQTLTVALGSRSYPIYIGVGLLQHVERIVSHLAQPRVVIVTNTVVAPLYLTQLADGLRAHGVSVVSVVLPDGEAYKTVDTLNIIYDQLLAEHCERKTTLIALGGGVIGDLTGFAAACYLRGVPFIQVPTTLLAQVDSSVGGKTGVNHPLGKNMIGAFYQPRMVLADIDTLRTLPARELSAGLAEVIKYGLIYDAEFFCWLENNIERLRALDEQALVHAIHRSCAIKAEIVAQDEHESGVRALLNLGHTFGHAIESGMGYGNWLHGEAVAAGTVMAADLSRRMGWLNTADVARIRAMYVRAGLPERAPDLGLDTWMRWMGLDKKVEEGRIRFVLLRAIGRAEVTAEVPADVLEQGLLAHENLM